MRFRVVSLALFAAVGAACFAQDRSTPYVIYQDGAIFDVVTSATGMQATAKNWWDNYQLKHDGPKVTASQNSQSLRMALSEIDGTPKTPTKWSIHRCLPNGVGLGGGQVSLAILGVQSLTLPALDVAATQTADFGVQLISGDVAFDGFYQTSAAEKYAVKTTVQKKWLPANFRLKIGDLPCDRVSRVEGFTIEKGNADLNGDGVPDFVIRDSLSITLPVEDAAKFQDWFDATVDATAELKTFSLEYMDEDRNTLFTISFPASIRSLGYSDVFQGTTATPGRDVTITFRAKGIISVKSATGSGG